MEMVTTLLFLGLCASWIYFMYDRVVVTHNQKSYNRDRENLISSLESERKKNDSLQKECGKLSRLVDDLSTPSNQVVASLTFLDYPANKLLLTKEQSGKILEVVDSFKQ